MKTKRETKELGMDTHLGEGVVKGEKFQNTRKPSHWWVCGSFGVSEGNVSRKRKKKKHKNMHITTTPTGEVAQTLPFTTSEWRLDRVAWPECF